MLIRVANKQDAADIWQVFHSCLPQIHTSEHEPVPEALLKTHQLSSFTERIVDRLWQTWVAIENDCIVGFVTLRDGQHIFSLYVLPDRQGTGVGQRLLSHALSETNVSIITVNASLHAYSFYLKRGFVASAEPVFAQGVRYIPMNYSVVRDE